MKYLSISPIESARIYEMINVGAEIDVSTLAFELEDAQWKTEYSINDLCNKLMAVHSSFPINDGLQFEAEAACILHDYLKLPYKIAADFGFWRWLSLGPLLPVLKVRHQVLKPEHVALGSPWDALLCRLWFRADLGYDSSFHEDPYHLVRLGDLDFWRSHVLRADYSSCKALLRALIRFQYPDKETKLPRLKPSGDSNNGIRALSKRIKLRHALVAFELLDEEDCFRELSLLAEGLN